uniref:Uncharacterized protein n=1 Tax=Anguilla anguilla TaxID=7936 RepID=A0A0E9TER5_ANGAN
MSCNNPGSDQTVTLQCDTQCENDGLFQSHWSF